ncbi:hypothetical protein, partial [Komagataeibacter nataicola]|uniref:hypothetical protein n=1 Tax=Komagataeibacter nataicola TaxID=265960 RepID=UPI002231EC4D
THTIYRQSEKCTESEKSYPNRGTYIQKMASDCGSWAIKKQPAKRRFPHPWHKSYPFKAGAKRHILRHTA